MTKFRFFRWVRFLPGRRDRLAIFPGGLRVTRFLFSGHANPYLAELMGATSVGVYVGGGEKLNER